MVASKEEGRTASKIGSTLGWRQYTPDVNQIPVVTLSGFGLNGATWCAAFAAYERRVRPFVEDKQRKARRSARTFVPSSRLGVQLSYLTMKLKFTPLLARFIGKQFGFDSLLQPG